MANGGGASTVAKARRLRRTMSLPEVLLWKCLRRRSLGLKFRKQHPLDLYVLDFYCPEASLVVEVDGEMHDRGDRPARDARRDQFLRDRGLTVVRVPARDVLANPETVAEAVVASVVWPLHHRASRDGPPPHDKHGEDQE